MTKPSFLGPAVAGYCGLLLGTGLGRFGYPPLIPAMVEAGWASPHDLHLAGAFNLAGYVAGAMATVFALKRLGMRATLIVSAILATLAFVLSIVPQPPFVFIALRALSGFAGAFPMIAAPAVVAASVDPAARGRAGGFAFAGVGSGFLFSGTVLPLLASEGPAPAWAALSAIMVAATVVMVALLPKRIIEATPVGPQAPFRRSPAYWGLAAVYGAAGMSYVPHTLVFVDYVARDLGHGLAIGGLAWIVAGLAAVITPVVAGFAVDRLGVAPTLRVVATCMALGAFMPSLTSNVPLLLVSAFMGGGMMIGLGSLTSGRTREIVGGEAYVRAWAELTVLFALAQALAAYGVTALLAAGAGHPVVFVVAGGLLAAGLAVEFATRER